MHFETSAGFHKKLLKRKQSNLKSILVFETQKKQTKKAITAVKEKVAVKHGQQTFLTLLLGGCMYALNLSRRSCAVSITYWEERIRISSTGPATGHDALVTEPVCGGERENVERSDGWMSDGERLPRCFVLRTRKTSKLGGAPEVENPINYAARGHTIFITNTVHTPCLPGMCENPRLMCVPLCPLRASWLFSWRRWTHDWSCGAFVVAKRRPKKPISGTAALFHIHKFEY